MDVLVKPLRNSRSIEILSNGFFVFMGGVASVSKYVGAAQRMRYVEKKRRSCQRLET